MRRIEQGFVRLGLIDPTVKALADLMRDDPDTFTQHCAPDWRATWLLHTSRVFSVVCYKTRVVSMVPRFRVIDREGTSLISLRCFDRLLLAISWPHHLRPKRRQPDAWYCSLFA
ncbi:hypothetical protein WS89_04155 [Burkholderia sp. MSMB1072]|uniref:hypothetical protein n=1 Tax=Burkholderia sp. MSMB1072 TaxID=1637871 RepID=UPI000756AF94|nr:hypothetical protein [Burkholderia sp. MSMB1072]KVH64484.1 hypothetical protein WS89_04155 [Burkholderia sp. MSMB1072]